MIELSNTGARFYRHSGKAPILGLVLIGIAGFIATFVLGVIYGYLLYFIPFIYLNFLIVLGYIYAISYVLSWAAKFGKVRNILLISLAALAFGLLAEYVGWVSWLAAILGSPVNLIGFFFPLEVIAFIQQIARQGAWTIFDFTPTGVWLYLVWLGEAVAVIGGITYLTYSNLMRIPFCEDSDAWAEKHSIIGTFAPLANSVQFRAAISQGGLSAFNALTTIQPGQNRFTMLELFECDKCRNFFVLNVNDVEVKTDKKGKQDTKVKSIVSNLIVTPSTVSGLRRLIEEKALQSATPAV